MITNPIWLQLDLRQRGVKDDVTLIKLQREVQGKAQAVDALEVKFAAVSAELAEAHQANDQLRQLHVEQANELNTSIDVAVAVVRTPLAFLHLLWL